MLVELLLDPRVRGVQRESIAAGTDLDRARKCRIMPARIASVPFEIAHRAFDARNKLEIASQEHNVMADAERGFGYFWLIFG